MVRILTANELKQRGAKALRNATSDNNEAIITVRGKSEYVVLPISLYNQLRENELEIALIESKRDIENGKFFEESVEEHIKRIIGE
ncbi:MAG: type II toxin-antitoxin system prevent-host-death family antitoxin [Actinomycetota bacterium]|nr:type II toxin-antitoxin system prevent-host-death family antitoxin [Actinomycetota bacterium]